MTGPLAHVRIADFTWLGAGSYATKILADFGADVIKIESSERVDSLRLAAPYKDGRKGVNRSGYFADRNSSKRSVTINMKHPAALSIVRRLVLRSDVVANNFAPGVMERFGLGYEAVCEMKPDIIYLAMSMLGSGGPESSYIGYGAGIVALSGLQYLSGLPGREPAGTGTNYPDHVPNPCHAAFAVLAALRYRRRTGKGQFIDLAQLEPTVALLGPTLLDLTVNGRMQERQGNGHEHAAPHGVYPCMGDDRWIAIAVTSDAQWARMISILSHPDLREGRWRDQSVRHREGRELDARISRQTASWDAEELMNRLQAAGVSAGVVRTAADLLGRDPQLAHRGHWVRMNHAEMGDTVYNAPPFRFSRSQVGLRRPAPLLGEHTREVCTRLLGLTAAEYDQLTSEGALR